MCSTPRRAPWDVDGEMASQDIKDRYALLAGHLGISAASSLQIVAADWQEASSLASIRQRGKPPLSRPWTTRIDFFDNRSCLFDPEGEERSRCPQRARTIS